MLSYLVVAHVFYCLSVGEDLLFNQGKPHSLIL